MEAGNIDNRVVIWLGFGVVDVDGANVEVGIMGISWIVCLKFLNERVFILASDSLDIVDGA